MGYHCAIEFPCGVLLFYCCKYPHNLWRTRSHKCVNTGKQGPPIVSLLFILATPLMFCTRLANRGLFPTGDPIVPFVINPQFECLNKLTQTFVYRVVGTFHCSFLCYIVAKHPLTLCTKTLWGH